uniref:Putative product n=1 Tax=Xenopsylla cheopis TaxID=163159 RepID=A0A6M2DY57_XENCH
MLELATLLLAVGMYNFSMAFLIGSIYIPLSTFLTPKNRLTRGSRLFWLLLQPLVLFSICIIISSFIYFPEETTSTILKRSYTAIKASITYGVVDSMIYGNWAFNMITAILVPNWLLFWIVYNTNPEIKCKND